MLRIRLLALLTTLLLTISAAAADDKWATVKGQVVLPASVPIPKPMELNVTQDKMHCLSKGAILDDAVIVNPKNRGIKNVVVWLRPDNPNPKATFKPAEIYPEDAKRKPAEIDITQPCCMFVNRITVARPGDTLVVKNPAPVPHNFFWSSSNNGEENVTIPKEGEWKLPNSLKFESAPIQFKCTIHGWMKGYVRIFDHPYYAITDENGNFEIKNAPVGKYRIVFWSENGLRGGANGRFGEPITIAGPTTEMKPVDFDVTKTP